MKPRPRPTLATMAALTVVYFVAGRIGLSLAFLNASATPVWPPAGIALAALLIFGTRAWPAIALGAFLVNATTTGAVVSSFGIAAGNTLEALVGAALVARYANGRRAFERARDVFKFALAALGATAIAATIGLASLAVDGLARSGDWGDVWLTWWLGDATGALLVTPALLLWSAPSPRWPSRRAVEAGALALLVCVVGGAVFGGLLPMANKNYPLEFLCLPLLVWAAYRFGPRGSATASLVLSAIAIAGTIRGLGPFKQDSRNESLLLLQAYLGVVTVTTVALAAVVGERRRVQDSLSVLETAVDGAVEGIFILTPDRGRGTPRITYVNDAFRRITGLDRTAALGRSLTELKLLEDAGESAAALRRSLYANSRFHSDALRAKRSDGTARVLEVDLTPMAGGGASGSHWVGVVRDVTEKAAHIEVLEHQALYDALTGLPNRVLLRDRLDQAIRSVGRQEASLALLVMDVDRFKDINDMFGHPFGDILLKEFGQRLRTLLRTVDTVARLGGDEFAVLLPAAGAPADAARMAEKILAALATPFSIEGQRVDVTASIGIAVCPRDGDDWTTLLRCADIAMYAAKQSNDGYVVYSSSDDAYGVSGAALMRELRAGVENRELHLHFQPQIDMRSRSMGAVEALVRWKHPRRGLLLPGQFLPAAERTGMIKPVCEWALEAALAECQVWHASGRPMEIAVNLSGPNLRDPLLSERLTRLLGATNVEPRFLKLEISERGVAGDPHGAAAALGRLRASGVRLSIDDFGGGESSLSCLKQLPVDEIKIAGALVRTMARDPRDAAIVRFAIDLGHSLGRQVVAEDVEDAESWKLLSDYGCDFAQGRYISPALPASDLVPWLDRSAGSA